MLNLKVLSSSVERRLVLGIALALAIGTPLFAQGTAAELRAASVRGKIKLGSIAAFARSPLRSVTISEPEVTDAGEVFGKTEFGSGFAKVALHPVNAEISDATTAWVLAIDAQAAKLSELIPPLEGSVADSFSLGRSAIVLCTQTVRVDESSLSPRVANFYRQYFESPRLMMELASGVNCLTRVSTSNKTAVGTALKLLGVRCQGLLLQGCVLKDATFSELKEAKKNSNLKERLRQSMDLRAYLPPIEIKGLPANYETGEASLIVSGKPGVGVGFRLVAPGKTPLTTQSFECRVDVSSADFGATETKIIGTAQGTWASALGIKGFDLIDTRLILSVDNQQKVAFGVRAGLSIGSREMSVAAQLKLHAVTGVPVGGFFEGSLESLGSKDLVAFANVLGKAAQKKPLKDNAMPEFELKDLYLKFAPMGADSDLGVSDGFALRGELHALKRKFAYVDGELTLDGIVPEIALRGKIGDIDLGAVALKGAAVDIKMGVSKDQHFKLKGETQLLALRRSVDVNIGTRSIYFDTWEELKGVYRTEYHVSSPAAGKPTWNLRAAFRNDFSKTLEREVSKKALAWANKVERDFQKAQQNLDKAVKNVEKISIGIESMRRTIRGERAKHQKGLTTAQSKVQSIQKGIDNLRSSIKTKRNKKKAGVSAKKKKMDAAHKAWKAAVKARKKAKVWDKPKKKAIEAGKFTAYKAKQAAYNTAKAAYNAVNRIPIDADPRIVALFASKKTANFALVAAKKLVASFPIDADPRVAAQFVARETAKAALAVAKGAVFVTGKAVAGAGKVTAWAARNNGKLLMLDEARFAAQLAGYLRGNKVDFASKVRFLGKPHNVDFRVSPAQIVEGKVFDVIWDRMRATLN